MCSKIRNLILLTLMLLSLFILTDSVALSECAGEYGNLRTPFTFAVPLGMLVLAPALASTWIVWIRKERKLMKHRDHLFEQNGGKLFMKKVSKLKEPAKKQIKVYTADDMRNATNNYRNKMAYKCGLGTCYRGRLTDGHNTETEAVIMKIPNVPKSQINEFLDQLIFLSKPHKNLVKIIGCCLETGSPLLAYEFHGEVATLFDHVHDEDLASHFTDKQLVEAAAGAARALTYLHSQNSRPIVHGNVSSANIFLDDSNEAKLFYDVASNLTPQGICSSSGQENYVHRHPEFSSSDQLNQMTDVYCFGSILNELLPGWKATAPAESTSDGNVAPKVKEEIDMLARRCLSENPEERPDMKDIEAKLGWLMHLNQG